MKTLSKLASPPMLMSQLGARRAIVVLGIAPVVVALASSQMLRSTAQEKANVDFVVRLFLPDAVCAALDRAGAQYTQPLEGVRWTKGRRLSGDRPLFQIVGVNGRGNKVEIEITHAGRILEVEEHGIRLDEVPPTVFAAIQTKMPDFDSFHVEAIYQGNSAQPTCFGFESDGADGKRREVYISADGMIVN